MRTLSAAVVACCLAASCATAQTPRPAPDLEIELSGGKTLALKSLRGKVVVLAFVSTTCPHCVQVVQALSEIQRQYGPRGVQIVASAFNEPVNEQVVSDFVRLQRPTFPVGWNTRVAVYAFSQYSILSQKPYYVPHLMFIDRAGVIQADIPGEDPFLHKAPENIRAQLDKMLGAGEKAPPTKK